MRLSLKFAGQKRDDIFKLLKEQNSTKDTISGKLSFKKGEIKTYIKAERFHFS